MWPMKIFLKELDFYGVLKTLSPIKYIGGYMDD